MCTLTQDRPTGSYTHAHAQGAQVYRCTMYRCDICTIVHRTYIYTGKYARAHIVPCTRYIEYRAVPVCVQLHRMYASHIDASISLCVHIYIMYTHVKLALLYVHLVHIIYIYTMYDVLYVYIQHTRMYIVHMLYEYKVQSRL